MSWGVRRIEEDPYDREAEAQRRTTMSVGEWLDTVAAKQRARGAPLAQPAARTEASPAQAPVPTGAPRPSSGYEEPRVSDRAVYDSLDRRLEDLNQRIKRLSDGSRQPSPIPQVSQPQLQPQPREPARSPVRDPGRDQDLREIAASIARLSGEAPRPEPAAVERAVQSGPSVFARLDDIDRRLGELAHDGRPSERNPRQPQPQPRGDYGAQGQQLRSDYQPVPQPRADQPGPSVPRDPEGQPNEVDRLRRGLRDIERLNATLQVRTPFQNDPGRGAAGGATLDTYFRRLTDQINALNASAADEIAKRLEVEIRSMRQTIEARNETGGHGLSEDELGEIRAIGSKLEALAADRRDPEQLDRLFAEMNRLRDAVLDADMAGSLRNIEAGYGHVVARLDDLKRSMADPRMIEHIGAEIGDVREALRSLPPTTEFNQVERRIQALAGKLDDILKAGERSPFSDAAVAELRQRIDALDPAKALRQLEDQLKALSDKIDTIETTAAKEANARASATDDRLAGLIDRLDTLAKAGSDRSGIAELSRSIDAIASRLNQPREPQKPVVPAGLFDLDVRIDRLGDKIDRLEKGTATSQQFAALETEISSLRRDLTDGAGSRAGEEMLRQVMGRLDRLDSDRLMPEAALSDIVDKAMRRYETETRAGVNADLAAFEARLTGFADVLDRLAGSGTALDLHVEALEREVGAMRRDLVRLTSQSNSDLQEQMGLLVTRLETMDVAGSGNRLVAQIEEQVGRIVDRLEVHERRFSDIGGIEAKLGTLETLLADRHEDALDAARLATRDAVKEFAQYVDGSRQSDTTVRAIADDLRQIQEATRTSESRTTDALQSVHDALTTIVSRLGSLERAKSDPAPALAAQPPHAVGLPPSATAARPAAEVPPPNPEDHRPLEPGSGKPSGVPGAKMSMPEVEAAPPGQRRAEFIAAARRAAQAAAQTSTAPPVPPAMRESRPPVPDEEVRAEAKPAKKSLFAGLFKGRRQPLVIAILGATVAALALAVGSTQLTRTAQIEAAAPPSATVAPAVQTTQTASADPALLVPGHADIQPMPPPVIGPQTAASDPALAPPTSVTQTFTPMQQMAALSPAATAPTTAPPAAAFDKAFAPKLDADRTATQSIAKPEDATVPMPADKIGSLALRTAAMSGDAKAQFEVGMRYAEGRGVAPDPKEAAAWYERAAGHSFQPAAYRLGSAYEKGLGVPRDVDKAKHWYQIAAEGGNVRAMHNLGVLFANGRDMASALPWFQKAAEAGLKDSQFNLGIIYALGSGVKADLAASYKWFALAAAQGDQEAGKKRDDIATHLDKTVLATAKLAVSTWKMAPLSRAANEEAEVWVEPAGTQATNNWALIMKAQSALQVRGLYSGPIDGTLSAATKLAVKAYQKKAGQKTTGDIDEALVNALSSKTL
ncbi:MAG: peptidoglycan-binding protein [Ancalomicrobiaceae bacterium]|nr:peptidoglycan-binding protein [Ancalomicrobiaceae bacterium]